MTDAEFDEAVEAEEALSKLEGLIEERTSAVLKLRTVEAQLQKGAREAKANLEQLKKSPVVSLDQFRLVRALHGSFEAKLNQVQANLEETTNNIKQFEAEKTIKQARLKALQPAETTAKILEFPNAPRRSQEED